VNRKPSSVFIRIFFAFSLVGLAYTFSFFIEPISQGHSLFLFISAVILASLYSGLFAAILSSLFAAFLHSYAFQEPRNEIGIHSLGDLIQIVAFLVVSIFMSFIGASMREARRKAERASEAREDVLAVVSHDLRNPLTAIKMNVELGLKSASLALNSDDPKVLAAKRAFETIARAADRMNELISNLLDHEKIRSGHLTISLAQEDLRSLMNEVVEIGGPLAAKKGIEFQAQILPSQGSATILCDRSRILQVFSNLLGNAVKFTEEKGRITVDVISSVENIEFVVQDTGPGIKSGDLEKVFDRYWQAQQTAKQGTGLGLSIAKGIVDAHSGRIWVESEPGKGCAFHFTIPSRAS
jgi:signal transduction histidine kinase